MDKDIVTRATQSEMEQRMTVVYGWLMQRLPRHQMVKMGSEMWNISNRVVDEIIRRTREEMFFTNTLPDREKLLSESIEFWKDFIRRCQAAHDRKNESAAQQHLDKICGLLTNKLDITSDGKPLSLTIEIIRPDENTSI